MDTCPICGGILPPEATFCGNCGVKLTGAPVRQFEVKPCPFCGNEIEAHSTKCPYCARYLSPTVSTPRIVVPELAPDRRVEGQKVQVPATIFARGVVELAFGSIGLIAVAFILYSIISSVRSGASELPAGIGANTLVFTYLLLLIITFAVIIYCGIYSFKRPLSYTRFNTGIGLFCAALGGLGVFVKMAWEGRYLPWEGFLLFAAVGIAIVLLTKLTRRAPEKVERRTPEGLRYRYPGRYQHQG